MKVHEIYIGCDNLNEYANITLKKKGKVIFEGMFSNMGLDLCYCEVNSFKIISKKKVNSVEMILK